MEQNYQFVKNTPKDIQDVLLKKIALAKKEETK